jgi:hypothetical protein
MKTHAFTNLESEEVEELFKKIELTQEERENVNKALNLADKILKQLFTELAGGKEHSGIVLRGALLTIAQTVFTQTCEMVKQVEGEEHLREHITNLMMNPIREQGYILSLHSIGKESKDQ